MPHTRTLLAGSAVWALAVTLAAPASAQAFNGTPGTQAGSVTYNRSTPGQETITVNSPNAVILWNTTNPSQFLPAGSVATYRGGSSNPNYTVLNRIFSTSAPGAITFNGAVRGYTDAGQQVVGGNILFYSPSGIIAGPTSTFTVGSLVLTTDDVQFDVTGSLGTPIRFRGGPNSTAAVEIKPGAQLNAVGTNSYVALVAPRVVQGGTVTAGRNIAYIAGEQVDVTVSAGVFDFTINVGTTDANGIVHTGTSTGPATTSSYDYKNIYMAALPKNDALTMLLGGSVGYTQAANAYDDGGAIILSAGYDRPNPTSVPANRDGSIQVNNTTFLNSVYGYATDSIFLNPNAGTIAFQGRINYLNALRQASAYVYDLSRIEGTNLVLNAGDAETGGRIDFETHGGDIAFTQQLQLNANNHAGVGYDYSPYGAGTGGIVSIGLYGGSITAPYFYASADGYAGSTSGAGQDGAGGLVYLAMFGGRLQSDAAYLSANGVGGSNYTDQAGGNGTGGRVSIFENGGQLAFGEVNASATGYGGYGSVGGNGIGGQVSIDIYGQHQTWGVLNANASAFAGEGASQSGGSAMAVDSAIQLTVSGSGGLAVGPALITADATGAEGTGPVQAGGILVQALTGGELSMGSARLSATGYAVANGQQRSGSLLNAPAVTGGLVTVLADEGTISANDLALQANAYGAGALTTAGAATGGTAEVTARNDGRIAIDASQTQGATGLRIAADAFGAGGIAAADANGGTARLIAEDGTVNVIGTLGVSADGGTATTRTIPNGAGQRSRGGTATVELRAGTLGNASVSATSLEITARGDGRLGFLTGGLAEGQPPPQTQDNVAMQGDGASGTGGTAALIVDAGTLSVGALLLDASGFGGASASTSGATAFQSGTGTGGTSRLTQTGGVINATSLELRSNGYGGGDPTARALDGELVGAAGAGAGGLAQMTLSGGSLTSGSTRLLATGTGAEGMARNGSEAGGNAGSGTGGSILLQSLANSTGNFAPGSLVLDAGGFGGAGGSSTGGSQGNGGNASGGTAAIDWADGRFAIGATTVTARGTGGSGALGGEGSGGTARFALSDTAGPSGTRSLASLALDASGTGGSGAQSDAGSAIFTMNALTAPTVTGDLSLTSQGTRAAAGNGIVATVTGTPLVVGGNIAMTTSRDIGVTATQALRANGNVTAQGRSFAETGLLAAGGNLSIDATSGITAERLSSGGTTLLQALGGAVTVSGDLASAGAVTGLGRSIDIVSSGPLSFANAQATAGNLAVAAAGGLAMAQASASGAVTLSSSAGPITFTGPLQAGGAVSASSNGALSLGTVVSGGATSLQSAAGAVTVTALTSPGAVTARGNSVAIGSPGALSFADLLARSGAATVTTVGNLALAQGSANGALTLTSTGGSVVATGALIAGGAASLAGANGITVGTLTSGGTTSLISSGGAVSVTSLTSPGAVTARGTAVTIAAPGALSFADLQASAGNAAVTAGGNLALAQASATGGLTLTSTSGNVTGSGPFSSGGASAISGASGIRLASLNSGGTTSLLSSGGAVSVSSLTSSGAVTTRGTAVTIGSPGALNFTDLQATGGDVSVTSAGNLSLAQGSATGSLSLTSTGGTLTAAGALSSGGAAALSGAGGVTLGSLISGGTTSLISTSGAVSVTSLTSPGAVTARGTAVTIASPGALSFADLRATAGNASVTAAGNLSFAQGSATGTLTLSSTSGSLTGVGGLVAGGAASLSGATGVNLGALTSGGVTSLLSSGGAVTVSALSSTGAVTARGTAVTLASPGSLTFADLQATSGNATVTAAGALALGPASASGDVTARAGTTLTASGPITGTNVLLAGPTALTVNGNVTARDGLTLTSNSLFSADAVLVARTISASSADIALGTNAKLGALGTTATLSLTNTDASAETRIGEGNSYGLNGAELNRLYADNAITITAAAPQFILDTITMDMTHLGSSGTLRLIAPGTLNVIGNAQFSNASAGQTVSLQGANLFVVTDNGGLGLASTSGARVGTLRLAGNTIAIGSSAVLGALPGLATLDAISARLDQPDAKRPDILLAGTISVNVADAFYVQNSGTSNLRDERRGFTADALNITTGSSATRIAINGRIATAAGFAQGTQTAPLITINGLAPATGGQFDPRSTVNGCVIGPTCAADRTIEPDAQIELDAPFTDASGSIFVAPLIELAPREAQGDEPLIDEPITGVGNDDLWQPVCTPEDGQAGRCVAADQKP